MSIQARFAREILRLGGVGINDPEIFPGTPLERVQLETFELATDRTDALRLDGGQDLVIQGTDLSRPAEEATFTIDGVTVLTEAPRYRLAFLRTNIGIITGYLFEAGDNQVYFISQTRQEEVVNLNAIIETSTVRQVEEVGGISCPRVGLFPEGSQLLTGRQFNIATNPAGTQISVTDAEVTDTDGIRDNGLETGAFLSDDAAEITATLVLKNGSRLTDIRGLRQVSTLSYGTSVRSHVFEQATLDSAGISLDDIETVEAINFISNDLTYFDLGFQVTVVEPLPDLGTNPTGPPPTETLSPVISPTAFPTAFPTMSPLSQFNIIQVTGGGESLRGTDAADIFVLGAQADNGSRDSFRIRDFDFASDFLVLEEGATIRGSRVRQDRLVLTLNGDRDRIIIDGAPSGFIADVISLPGPFVFDPSLFPLI